MHKIKRRKYEMFKKRSYEKSHEGKDYIKKNDTKNNCAGKEYRVRGMLTVEASLLIPLAVIVFGIMLSLSFHVYQRCWYTQAACETVLYASISGVKKGTDGSAQAKEKWNTISGEFYLVPQKLTGVAGGNKDHAELNITGATPIWGREGIKFSIQKEHKIIKPVVFIRRAAALKEIKSP
ncbi:MAG: hypothetical protein EOM40_04285 [Clostridia bacterium]|nr:hypothetical protein [Clostridia bacterium]NCC43891.1 hypothetical protein [Clostridia bacterium]